jgi:hypothetical protein
MSDFNGIPLGPNSPLLTTAGARRRLQASEEDMQIQLMELLVGRTRPGEPRRMGDGLTARHPELFLTYAVPNGGVRDKGTAGRMKAQGVLKSMPDLCLPVMRGPFITLFIELKVPGKYGTKDQRQMAELLRAHGHCVIECQGVQEALETFLGYLALGENRPSVRPMGARAAGNLTDRLQEWRAAATTLLTPKRR